MTIQNESGHAYGRKPEKHDPLLTEVDAGKPMGELLRRYWHPIGLCSDATHTPRVVRILGEELILFRDGLGRPGLLTPRCMHRGASLFYGKVDAKGIRCCYHGWLFDVEGRCLEQPCEPAGGRGLSRFRQPWYPVKELYGLIFAYLGPPEKMPVLPRYAALENLEPGQFVEADDSSIGSGGDVIVPCNWLQHFENVMDPYHVFVLHSTFSGTQFVAQMGIMPRSTTFKQTARGVMSEQIRVLEDGKTLRRVTETVMPTVRVVASPRLGHFGRVESIGWVLPLDNTHFRVYVAGRVSEKGQLRGMRSTFNGKSWFDLTPQEHQQFPGDYEAQVGQGPIAVHSHEHLVTSDRGVGLLRRLLEKQVALVAEGGDPIGVDFASNECIELEAGNYLMAQ